MHSEREFLKNAVLHHIAADLQEVIIDTTIHVAGKDDKHLSGVVHHILPSSPVTELMLNLLNNKFRAVEKAGGCWYCFIHNCEPWNTILKPQTSSLSDLIQSNILSVMEWGRVVSVIHMK